MLIYANRRSFGGVILIGHSIHCLLTCYYKGNNSKLAQRQDSGITLAYKHEALSFTPNTIPHNKSNISSSNVTGDVAHPQNKKYTISMHHNQAYDTHENHNPSCEPQHALQPCVTPSSSPNKNFLHIWVTKTHTNMSSVKVKWHNSKLKKKTKLMPEW